MRRLELLLFLCFIGLAGAAYFKRDSLFPDHTLHGFTGVHAPASPDTADKAKKKEPPKPITKRLPRDSSGAALPQPPEPITPPVPTPAPTRVVTAKPLEFAAARPGVEDALRHSIGATRTDLRKQYGVPQFAVSATSNGSLIERYYYANLDYTNMAVAILRNGKLVSVENVQY